MKRDSLGTLLSWLHSGGREAGQILIRSRDDGFELCHRADADRGDLTDFAGPEAARQIANFDETGQFRPLKTIRNLRRGWRLRLANVQELQRALEGFYPAMLGVWQSWQRGELLPVPLRATLDRQSGMYRVARKITNAQAEDLIAGFCPACLKQRLWTVTGASGIESAASASAAPAFPLFCHEACNLLVAKAREVVKKSEGAP